MRKLYLVLLVLALVCFARQTQAKIIRIGYPGGSLSSIDYAYNNIAAAITAAAAGDTIQLYQQYWPGTSPFSQVSKKLVFIGFGYFLDKNSGLQSITSGDVYTVNLQFNAGSEGSVVEGAFGNFYINTNNIWLRRTRINTCYLYDNNVLSDIKFTQCYIGQIVEYYASKGASNIVLKNNYIGYVSLTHSTGIFSNNVVDGTVSLNSFLVKNNIIDGCVIGSLNIIQNNLFSTTCSAVSGNNNQFNVNFSNVFSGWNFGILSDSSLVLKAGSVAINAGVKNDNTTTNAGVFGGEPGEAYRLSGIPAVPSIYKMAAASQTVTTNPYVITVSIRGNN